MGYSDKEKQREYQKQWIAKRRAKYLEGKSCAFCGSSENLEIDHINPEQKTFNPSALWSMSETNPKRIAELAKCQILCSDCHGKKTLVDISNRIGQEILQHGTATMYDKHGCRCPPCREAATIKRRRFVRN
jgi:hypothetical protein